VASAESLACASSQPREGRRGALKESEGAFQLHGMCVGNATRFKEEL